MEQFVTFGIVGLSTAAIYAIISSGLVVTYTTTGVFNFAHGATGMMAAFAYWQLSIGWGWPVWLSVITVLFVLAPAFGLLVEQLMRPVQRLGEAERLVMTIALLSGLIAVARWIWDPNKSRSLPAFFAEKDSFHIGAATVSWHQALTMVVAVAVALGLRLLMFNTRTGAEMRATVDDRALVGLTGADPVRANRVAWILGTTLAALGGILIAPMVALDATQLSLLIVSAYAAAIFGRLKSLPMTFVGAIVIGCMEAYLAGYLPQNEYLPGLRLAAPALVLLLALLLFPHGRLRGRDRHLSPVPLPSVRGTFAFAGVIVAFGLLLATVLGAGDLITYGQIFAVRCHRAVVRPARRVRRPDLAVPAQHGRHRCDRVRTPRRRRTVVGADRRDGGRGRRRSRRRGTRAPAVGGVPGAGHGRDRRRARPVDLLAAVVRTSSASTSRCSTRGR